MIKVKEINPKLCYPIRHKVLWQHKSIDECGIDIDEQEGAFHLGVFYKGGLVCVGSFFKQKHPQFTAQNQYRLRAMATLPQAQKKGAAKVLLEFAFKKLQEEEQEILWCDARIIAVGFYEKLGFEKSGEKYEIPLIGPHYLMSKTLHNNQP